MGMSGPVAQEDNNLPWQHSCLMRIPQRVKQSGLKILAVFAIKFGEQLHRWLSAR